MSECRALQSLQLGSPTLRPGTDHVTILLATFNGEAHIGDQLESYLAQTHRDWSLLVSDDGSTDDTCSIIRNYSQQHPERRITLLRGPGKGSAANFLSLLRAAGTAPFIAFSDQDDVWFPDKLSRALAALKRNPGAGIYGGRTKIADGNLRPLRNSLLFRRTPSFGNALVQNIAGGNTMVANRPALDFLQPASLYAAAIISHDWWCYQMVTGSGGRMIYDTEPCLLYRQHGKNQIGANDSMTAAIARIRRLFQGQLAIWTTAQSIALSPSRRWITPDAQRQLDLFLGSRNRGPVARILSLHRAGIARQTRRGSLALWLAAGLGRL
jgi:hypothetical protein